MHGQSEAAKPPYSVQTGWSVRRNLQVFAGLTTPAFGHPSSARRGILFISNLQAYTSLKNRFVYSSLCMFRPAGRIT